MLVSSGIWTTMSRNQWLKILLPAGILRDVPKERKPYQHALTSTNEMTQWDKHLTTKYPDWTMAWGYSGICSYRNISLVELSLIS